MDADAYVAERLEDQISWYDAKSVRAQRSFKSLRLTEIIAAASIPLLSGFVDPERPYVTVIMGLLGALVAVIAAVLGLYQHERNWVDYRTTCEALKWEKYLFMTGTAPFGQQPEANYRLLVQRVEGLLSEENTKWGEDMTNPSGDEDPARGPLGEPLRTTPPTPPVSP